jgi:hypothetical protein
MSLGASKIRSRTSVADDYIDSIAVTCGSPALVAFDQFNFYLTLSSAWPINVAINNNISFRNSKFR